MSFLIIHGIKVNFIIRKYTVNAGIFLYSWLKRLKMLPLFWNWKLGYNTWDLRLIFKIGVKVKWSLKFGLNLQGNVRVI